MLPRVAQITYRTRRIYRHGVTCSNAVEVYDLISVAVVDRVEQKQAAARHAFQPVDAIAIERNVKCVRVSFNPCRLSGRSRAWDRLRSYLDCLRHQCLRAREGGAAERHVLHSPSASTVALP